MFAGRERRKERSRTESLAQGLIAEWEMAEWENVALLLIGTKKNKEKKEKRLVFIITIQLTLLEKNFRLQYAQRGESSAQSA